MANIQVLSIGYDDLVGRGTSLITNNDHFAQTIAFIGSSRQSQRDNKDSTCFAQIPLFCKEIGAEFNPFLLADIYNDTEAGTAFQEAIRNEKEFQHKGWLHDPSKISIIYAQIHKIASENPNDNIYFEFYEDEKTLLTNLHEFFTTHKRLIPANVCLTLHHYTGKRLVHYQPIFGKENWINPYFAATIKFFGKAAMEVMMAHNDLFDGEGKIADITSLENHQYNSVCEFSILPTNSHPGFVEQFLDAHDALKGGIMALKAQINKAVNAYIAYNIKNCKYSLFHRHGATGRIRATKLLAEVNAIEDMEVLKEHLHTFIEDTRNGNTHPHSLRTMLS